jgi:ankyrin repeat protein
LPATKGIQETATDDYTSSDKSEMDAALVQAMQEFYKTKEDRFQALKNAVEAGACIQRTKAMCRAAADSTWGERNIQVLLQLGGGVCDRDEYGSTPLHIAAVFFNADAVEILIQKGADLAARDDDGLTPEMAFENSVERRMEMVQEFGMPLTSADRVREARIRSLL